MSNFIHLEHQAILSLSNKQFQQFVDNKMYKINKNFNSSQQCIDKLIVFIKDMVLNKQTVKIAKNLIKYYGVGIIIFFQPFYQKIKKSKNEIETNKNSILPLQQNIKNLEKLHEKCKELSTICRNIISPYKIQYLNFINVFGERQQKILKQIVRNQFQRQYLQFLQRISPKYLIVIQKNSLHDFNIFMDWIKKQKISREFNLIELLSLNQLKNRIQIKIQSFAPKNIKFSKSQKEQLVKVPLCCRQFFFQNERILVAENQNLQYKNYRFPYDPQRINAIRRTICGFLNGSGGTILIGVYESMQTKKKFVKGEFYSQDKKQKVLKEFRYICDQIYPKIVNGQMYNVKFVPIKTEKGDFIHGKYVLRIKIKVGSRQNMYSYINDGENVEYLAFRTANQILKRSLNQDILKLYRQKLQSSQPIVQSHFGECLPPQLGIPIFTQKNQDQEIKIEQAISLSLQEKYANQLKDKKQINIKNINSQNQKKDQKSPNVDSQTQIIKTHKKNWIIDEDQEQFKKKKSLQKKLKLIEQKQNEKNKNIIIFKNVNQNNLNQLQVSQNNKTQKIQQVSNVIRKKYQQKQSRNNYIINKNLKQEVNVALNTKIIPIYNEFVLDQLNNNYDKNQDDNQSSNHFLKKQKKYVKKSNQIQTLKNTQDQSWDVWFEYLFLAIPYKQILNIAKQTQLPSIDKCLIKCKSDSITWLRLKKSQATVEKMQQILSAVTLKKNDFPNFQFTIASRILSTKSDDFKLKLRKQDFIEQKNKQDQLSIFIFQQTYAAIKAFLKCWTPGQKGIRFTRDKKKQQQQKIMNILK